MSAAGTFLDFRCLRRMSGVIQMSRKRAEPKLDEEVEETFPASDPPSYMGSTAIAGAPKDGPRPESDGAHPIVEEEVSVNLNEATAEELGRMPALSPDLVQALIAARPFTSWEDLKQIPEFNGESIIALKKGGAFIGY
jgi:DNA uptake protein ComE-like DNA-binding protein